MLSVDRFIRIKNNKDGVIYAQDGHPILLRSQMYPGRLSAMCLAEICAVYLTLDGCEKQRVVVRPQGSGPTCQKSGRGAGLFDYAAKYWGTHYRLGHASSSASTGSCGNTPSSNKAITLCNTSTCTFHDWFQLYWNTISTSSKYPDKLTPLMIASHMGLLDLVRELLADGQSRNKTQITCKPLTQKVDGASLAVWNGHGVKNDDAIALLLQHHHGQQ
ncbi:hypothetical protein V3481_006980 [Fusarium oxysporum f. sp. vasinfectum]